jgi:hypothetical protein
MTFHARFAPTLSFAVLLLWLTAPSIASAQDAMELDLAFKNGQLQGHPSERRQEGNAPDQRRHDRAETKNHYRRKHPGQGR